MVSKSFRSEPSNVNGKPKPDANVLNLFCKAILVFVSRILTPSSPQDSPQSIPETSAKIDEVRVSDHTLRLGIALTAEYTESGWVKRAEFARIVAFVHPTSSPEGQNFSPTLFFSEQSYTPFFSGNFFDSHLLVEVHDRILAHTL